MPGSGGKETGLVSILDTLVFSVFGAGLYGVLQKIRGNTYTESWKKVWRWPPIFTGEAVARRAMAGVHSQLSCCSTVTFTFSSIDLGFQWVQCIDLEMTM
jgi:hypothetical protein